MLTVSFVRCTGSKQMLLVCFLLLSVAYAQTVVVRSTFTNAQCSSTTETYRESYIAATSAACLSAVQSCTAVPGTTQLYTRVACRIDIPSDIGIFSAIESAGTDPINGCAVPSTSTLVQKHTSTGGCGFADAGTISRLNAMLDIQLPPTLASLAWTCGWSLGASVVQINAYTNPDCTGPVLSITTSLKPLNICQEGTTRGNTLFIRACGENECFHESTVISYKGRELTLDALEKGEEEECTIPHVVDSVRGMKLTAKCGHETKTVTATSGHLIYTKGRGVQALKDLEQSDIVFADLDEKQECSIVSIEGQTGSMKFFGLNCHTSHVLANGLKTSTFERVHEVPSFWMSVMGKVLGIKRASRMGDYIEKLVSQLGLIL